MLSNFNKFINKYYLNWLILIILYKIFSHYKEYLKNESNSESSLNKYEHLFKRFINKPPSLEEALIDMFCSSGLSSDKSKSLFNKII